MGCAMPLIMAAYLGIADAAAALAVRAAEGRAATHVFQQLGEMSNRHLTAQDAVTAMFVDTENLQFANTDALSSRILSRKSVAAAAIIDTVQLAAEVAGGSAFSRGNDLERLLRDAHGVVYHPLPLAKQTQFTGRVALGLPPSADRDAAGGGPSSGPGTVAPRLLSALSHPWAAEGASFGAPDSHGWSRVPRVSCSAAHGKHEVP
jgi:hypothetical protein